MVLKQVTQLMYKHRYTWRDRSQWYWMYRLLLEVGELGLSLIGLHRGPVEWELLQISSICLNWREIEMFGYFVVMLIGVAGLHFLFNLSLEASIVIVLLTTIAALLFDD